MKKRKRHGTGKLFVYSSECPCPRDKPPQSASFRVFSPTGTELQRFEPLRTPEGSAILIDDMAFDADGIVPLFKGGGFTPADPLTGEFGSPVVQGLKADAGGGAAFDPVTGHLFTLRYDNLLAEVDPVTLDMMSVTNLDEFISFPSRRPFTRAARGMAFSPTGDRLYITADNHLLALYNNK